MLRGRKKIFTYKVEILLKKKEFTFVKLCKEKAEEKQICRYRARQISKADTQKKFYHFFFKNFGNLSRNEAIFG
jgi:hypothetical protein